MCIRDRLKLSDAFEKPTDDPKLELKCIVYNINAGKNRQILQKCVWLDEYMMFVNKVREYHSGKSYEELGNDIELAIDYCIDNDILKDFLKTHRSEVTKNMQLNYKFDRQLELERADAREEGLEEGRKEMCIRDRICLPLLFSLIFQPADNLLLNPVEIHFSPSF